MSADQASAQNTEAAPAAASDQASAPAASVDHAARVAELEAKLAAAEGKLSQSVRAEQAAREAKRKEAEEKARVAAEHGEFKALAEHNAKLVEEYKRQAEEATAKAAQYEPLASKWTSFEASSLKEVEARKASLPERWQKLLDRAADLDAKRDVLATFDAERADIEAAKAGTKQPTPKAAPAAAPPASRAPINLDRPSVADLQTLKATDPDAFNALIRGQKPSLLQSAQARLTGMGRK